MTLKEQWKKVQENWIIALVLIIVVISPYFSGRSFYSPKIGVLEAPSFEGISEASYAPGRMGRYYPPSYDQDFAPEVQDRKITKTSSLSTEVDRGTFPDAEQQLKIIISSTNSFLLTEQVNKQDSRRRTYYSGSYTIKVEVRAYDNVIAKLKEMGEVKSFSENAEDITRRYTNLQTELAAEKARLQRYEQMLAEAELIADKIELSDRIFDQERTIKYLEEALRNQDKQVEYATIYVQINEKQSNYAGIILVTLGELVHGLVSSMNNLLRLIFVVLPWIVITLVIWVGVRWGRRK